MATLSQLIRTELSLVVDKYLAGAEAKTAADQRMVDSGNKFAAAVTQTERKLADTGTAAERLARSLDPAYQAQKRLEAGTATLQRALDLGTISSDRHAELVQLLQQRYDAASSSASRLNQANQQTASNSARSAAGIRGIGDAAKLTYTEVEILRSGIINTIQSLAAGMGAARTFETQIFQIGPALGGVVRVLGLTASILVPVTAAFTAAAAVIGLFAAGLSRFASTENQIKQFGITLSGLGNSGVATGADLQKAFENIRDSGSSAAESLQAIQAVSRNPIINPSRAEEIIKLARDISVVTGENLPDSTRALTQALAGGVEGITKFATSLNSLSDPQARQLRQSGDLNIALKALEDRFGGKFQASLTNTSEATKTITAAWNGLLDAWSKTSVIEGLYNWIVRLVTAFGNLPANITAAASAVRDFGSDVYNKAGNLASGANQGFTNLLSPVGDFLRGIATQNQPVVARSNIETTYQSGGVLDRLTEAIIHFESGGNQGAISPTGAIGLMQLLSSTARELKVNPYDPEQNVLGGQEYVRRMTSKFGNLEAGLQAYNFGPGNYQRYLSGESSLPSGVRAYSSNILSRSGLTGRESAFDLGQPAGLSLQTQTTELTKQAEAFDRATKSAREFGAAQQGLEAYYRGLDEARSKGLEGEAREEFARAAQKQAINLVSVELGKQIQLDDRLIKSTLDGADAFSKSEAAGLRKQAELKATNEIFERFGNTAEHAAEIQTRANQILQQEAAAAVLSAEQQVRAFDRTVVANNALAEASSRGTAALQDARIANQAAVETQDAYAKALASGNTVLIERAKKLQDQTEAQIRANEASQETIQVNQQSERLKQQVDIIELQTRLQGESTAEIDKQVLLLRTRQQLETQSVKATQESKDNLIAQTTAIADANIRLEQQRITEARFGEEIRDIADTILNTIGRALDSVLSGQKITNWAATFRQALVSVASTVIQSELIKPLLGSLFGGLSPQLAQQYGTLGNIGAAAITGAGTSSGSLLGLGGSAFSAIGGLGKIFGGESFLGAGGLGGAFNSLGESLGFANAANIGPGVGGIGPVGGGIFGSTTLGQAVGGVGAGFAAGSILNSVLGGNQLQGTIGSATGAITGALIGSVVPVIGTLIGGLVGGAAGGGLGGLLGPRASTQASGNLLSLSTGAVGGFTSSGNATNDQTVQQISGTLSQFLGQIRQLTGGTIEGALNIVATTKGIQTSYNGPLGNIKATFASAGEAITAFEQAFLHNVSGVSDTIKTVLEHVSDPTQLQAALAFAAAYEKVGTAFDGLFSSIEDATTKAGPYSQILDQINAQYATLKTSAEQYGLSIAPVAQAYSDAQQRLINDFNKNVSDTLAALTDPFQAVIDAEVNQGRQRLTDAKMISADIAQVEKLNESNLLKIALNTANQLSVVASDVNDFIGTLGNSFSKLFSSFEIQISHLFTSTSGVQQISGGDQFSQAFNTIQQQSAAAVKAAAASFTDPGVLNAVLNSISGVTQAAISRLAIDFNAGIADLATAATDPLQEAITKEIIAGQQRVAVAQAVGADLAAVDRFNEGNLQRVAAAAQQATNNIAALRELMSGAGDTLAGSISSVTGTTQGPFADALDNLNTTFGVLINNIARVDEYTTDLTPVLRAYADQIDKLRSTFNNSIAQLTLGITDPVQAALNAEIDAGRKRVDEATKIGADVAAVDRFNALSLIKVFDDVTKSTDNTVGSLSNLSNALNGLKSAITQLTTGQLSGRTPGGLVSGSVQTFRDILSQVQGGDTSQIGDLIQAGTSAVSAAQSAYGNAPQTAKIRNEINQALSRVLDETQKQVDEAKKQTDTSKEDSRTSAIALREQSDRLRTLAGLLDERADAEFKRTGVSNNIYRIESNAALDAASEIDKQLSTGKVITDTEVNRAKLTVSQVQQQADIGNRTLEQQNKTADAASGVADTSKSGYDLALEQLAIQRQLAVDANTTARQAIDAQVGIANQVLAAQKAAADAFTAAVNAYSQSVAQAQSQVQAAAPPPPPEAPPPQVAAPVRSPEEIRQAAIAYASRPDFAQFRAGAAIGPRAFYEASLYITDPEAAIQNLGYPTAYAGGTQSAPPGWSIVGERGPEWVYLRGGEKILPNGVNPTEPANDDIVMELKRVQEGLAILQRQMHGGQVQANKDARVIATETYTVGRKLNTGLPLRRNVS